MSIVTAATRPRPQRPRRRFTHDHRRCMFVGKVRFRDHLEATTSLHSTVACPALALAAGYPTRRGERRAYHCDRCRGWHLTRQKAK